MDVDAKMQIDESNVELQVFRMNAPGKRAGGIKKRDRYRVIAGQMIARGSRYLSPRDILFSSVY